MLYFTMNNFTRIPSREIQEGKSQIILKPPKSQPQPKENTSSNPRSQRSPEDPRWGGAFRKTTERTLRGEDLTSRTKSLVVYYP